MAGRRGLPVPHASRAVVQRRQQRLHIGRLQRRLGPACCAQHRIGQTRPVLVYRLVAAGSIEERLLALQQRKAALADAVLGAADGGETALQPADVQALLAPLDDGA